MADFELVTGVYLDPDNKMLVVFDEQHQEWQLPGSRVMTAETASKLGLDVDEEDLGPVSLQRALSLKIGAEIDTDETNLIKLGRGSFEHGGSLCVASWYEVMRLSGGIAVNRAFYTKHDFVYPLSLSFLRERRSRNLHSFQRSLRDREIDLHFHFEHPVQ